jgi:hypothetical protein
LPDQVQRSLDDYASLLNFTQEDRQ